MRKFDGDKLVIASHNKGKLREMAELMEPFGVTVTSAADHNLDEPEETESTFVGNARIKAHFAAKATGLPALSDDSGITVDALDGAPGVYTADWAETPSGRDFPMAMTKVWTLLEERNAPAPRKAAFNCTLCLAWPDVTTKFSKVALTVRSSGRCAAKRGLGLIRCSCPMAKPKPSEKWIQRGKNR